MLQRWSGLCLTPARDVQALASFLTAAQQDAHPEKVLSHTLLSQCAEQLLAVTARYGPVQCTVFVLLRVTERLLVAADVVCAAAGAIVVVLVVVGVGLTRADVNAKHLFSHAWHAVAAVIGLSPANAEACATQAIEAFCGWQHAVVDARFNHQQWTRRVTALNAAMGVRTLALARSFTAKAHWFHSFPQAVVRTTSPKTVEPPLLLEACRSMLDTWRDDHGYAVNSGSGAWQVAAAVVDGTCFALHDGAIIGQRAKAHGVFLATQHTRQS